MLYLGVLKHYNLDVTPVFLSGDRRKLPDGLSSSITLAISGFQDLDGVMMGGVIFLDRHLLD